MFFYTLLQRVFFFLAMVLLHTGRGIGDKILIYPIIKKLPYAGRASRVGVITSVRGSDGHRKAWPGRARAEKGSFVLVCQIKRRSGWPSREVLSERGHCAWPIGRDQVTGFGMALRFEKQTFERTDDFLPHHLSNYN